MSTSCRHIAGLVAIGILPAVSRPCTAQYQTRTWLDWRTVQTEHFSVHYPAELETWAQAVASKMEGIDTAVSRVVGYSPRRRINIAIDDPYRISNGSAWPFI